MTKTIHCTLCDSEITFSDEPEYLSKNREEDTLDVDLGGEIIGKHDCPERERNYQHQRTPKKTMCWECGLEIVFSPGLVSKSGKKIPIDPDTGKAHVCAAWEKKKRQLPRKYVPCRRCNDDIYFSEDFKTDQGKWIPVDRQTNEAHKCL